MLYNILVPNDTSGARKMAILLDERLMKAADALIAQSEIVEVICTAAGKRRVCRLTGRGEGRETVNAAIWGMLGKQVSGRPIGFAEIELTDRTAVRLHEIAREQEAIWHTDEDGRRYRLAHEDGPISAEMARAMAFISWQKSGRASGARRDLSGRYAGHSCEAAGRR
jgi:hypothetical protein